MRICASGAVRVQSRRKNRSEKMTYSFWYDSSGVVDAIWSVSSCTISLHAPLHSLTRAWLPTTT